MYKSLSYARNIEIFTFHYVSILMPQHRFHLLRKTAFTFHYVSILILNRRRFLPPFLRLYIPLCLYFNAIDQQVCKILNPLYIPLCLYFNYLPGDVGVRIEDLYIPLCLYFN